MEKPILNIKQDNRDRSEQ